MTLLFLSHKYKYLVESGWLMSKKYYQAIKCIKPCKIP